MTWKIASLLNRSRKKRENTNTKSAEDKKQSTLLQRFIKLRKTILLKMIKPRLNRRKDVISIHNSNIRSIQIMNLPQKHTKSRQKDGDNVMNLAQKGI